MSRLLSRSVMACLAALALGAGAARAASIPFTGTLAIEFGGLDPIVVAGGGVAIVNGSGGGSHVDTLAMPASAFATVQKVQPITDPAAFPIMGVQLTAANAAGTIASSTGQIPLDGIARMCLFGPCSAAVANVSVPLAVVGNGGASLITGSVNLTVIGAPWTTGTASIGTITRMGFAKGPASNASSTALSGEMRLVTPIFVSTNIGPSALVPAFGILTLQFVPEPGTIALLSGGLALLAAAGRARLRRR